MVKFLKARRLQHDGVVGDAAAGARKSCSAVAFAPWCCTCKAKGQSRARLQDDGAVGDAEAGAPLALVEQPYGCLDPLSFRTSDDKQCRTAAAARLQDDGAVSDAEAGAGIAHVAHAGEGLEAPHLAAGVQDLAVQACRWSKMHVEDAE